MSSKDKNTRTTNKKPVDTEAALPPHPLHHHAHTPAKHTGETAY